MVLDELVDYCQRLYEDLDFRSVQAWKAAQPGRKAIGYMPIYVPREIIHATGMLPVGLMGGDMEIIRGDAYYQSYICHIPRSTIELGVSGRLDMLDGVIFPSICDVIRNLSGMWKLMFKDKYSKYLDLPQNFMPNVGGDFYVDELRSMAGDLQALSGVEVTNARLLESIRLYNRNRALVNALYDLRAAEPWRVPTVELYLLLRAGNVLPVEEHTELLQTYRALLDTAQRPQLDNSRIVLTGAFCEQPPLGLIRTIERAGCYIVEDDFVLGSRWIQGPVAETGDALANLVSAYLERSVANASVYIADKPKGESLVKACRHRCGEGVIFCAASFCDPALLDQPMLAHAVEAAGIPYTEFKYSENTGQFQVIKEQTGTFSDSLKLWGTT
ncbi:MAG: benzoyl-CoA reductase subunit C [Candidatus Lambdaproteobacteria bacterium]|nr:benzoyl-CoA reductase subunit C [Candidatus Lambdaproteobacteria bacterium]